MELQLILDYYEVWRLNNGTSLSKVPHYLNYFNPYRTNVENRVSS